MLFCFFFNDTATTEIYTLSLHDALPISIPGEFPSRDDQERKGRVQGEIKRERSEEHTSELQSHLNLVCRLLLEKKKVTFSVFLSYTVRGFVTSFLSNVGHGLGSYPLFES